MNTFLRRIRYWLDARRDRGALADEIETHRALTQAALEREGMTAGAAERASRRVMGNLTLACEDARAQWLAPWIESVVQDAAHAVRTVRRTPSFAASMILVTALGISATTAVFGLIDRLVLADLPVREPSRLVWFKDPAFSYPIFDETRTRSSRIFSGLFAWTLERRSVQWQEALEPADVLGASGDFYATLGVSAIAGRTFGPDDDRIGGGPDGPVAVISDDTWRRRYGRDRAAIGRTLRIDDVAFTVIGVTPPGFFGVAPGLAPEVTLPLATLQTRSTLGGHSSSWLHLMGRLRDGLTPAAADLMLQSVWPGVLESTTPISTPRERRAMFLGRTTALEPGRRGYSRVRNQFERPLWMLLGLGACLSVGASISAASLLLARGLGRRREIAVRLAIGAGRLRIVRQCLIEATVWTGIGVALAVVLASWSAGGLVGAISTWRDPVMLDVAPSTRTLLFAAALALVTAWVSAMPAALWLTRGHAGPGVARRQDDEGRGGRWSIGSALVAAQVALTIVLLAGAGLFVVSLQHILSRDAGFDREHVLVVSADAVAAGYKDGRQIPFYEELRDRLERLPGVQSASLSWYAPISGQDGHWTESIGIDGAPPGASVAGAVHFNAVSPGYFGTLSMRMVAGRDFARGDNQRAVRVVIVNESLARRFFPDGRVLGRRISIGRDASRQDLTIVGVVADAKYQRLQEAPRSIAYLPCAQLTALFADAGLVAEVRASGALEPIAARVVQEIASIDRRVPVRLETVADRIDDSLLKERLVARLSIGLGAAALALAVAAVYGLLTCTVSRQRKEIGVRRALGARRWSVLWMIVRQSIELAAAGIVVGLALSLALGRFVRSLLFEIEPSNPAALAGAAAIALVATVCAAALPARRAASIDPLVAIREE